MTLREFADRLDTIALPQNVIAAEVRLIADAIDLEHEQHVVVLQALHVELETLRAQLTEALTVRETQEDAS